MRLVIEHAAATSGPWLELDALDIEQTGDFELSVGNAKRYLRVSWEFVGGENSPSVTFSVLGEAHQVYCSPRDLGRYGIRAAELLELTTASARADGCIAVSAEADGYLNGGYTLPLLAWDDALRGQCARMAIRYALDQCGWQPSGPDVVIETSFDRALAWLKRLQAGNLDPPDITDSTPEEFEGGSVVMSRPRRSAI